MQILHYLYHYLHPYLYFVCKNKKKKNEKSHVLSNKSLTLQKKEYEILDYYNQLQ